MEREDMMNCSATLSSNTGGGDLKLKVRLIFGAEKKKEEERSSLHLHFFSYSPGADLLRHKYTFSISSLHIKRDNGGLDKDYPRFG